jgi:tetratricopeptide (TPR) repeat protein
MNILHFSNRTTCPFLMLLLAASLMMACQGGQEKQKSISELEKAYNDAISENGMGLRSEELSSIIRDLVGAYETFAKENPDDPKSVQYLYQAAELYDTNLGESNQAIAVFDRIIQNYGNHERASDALFKKAYIYNNTFGDTARARITYQEFLQRFPEHPMHESAEFELRNLGKTPEQILQEIQQQKQDSSQEAS